MDLTQICSGPCGRELPLTFQYFEYRVDSRNGHNRKCVDCKIEQIAEIGRRDHNRYLNKIKWRKKHNSIPMSIISAAATLKRQQARERKAKQLIKRACKLGVLEGRRVVRKVKKMKVRI